MGRLAPRLWHSTLAVPVGPAGVELCLAWGERSEPQDRHTAITIPGPRFRGPMSHRVAPSPCHSTPSGPIVCGCIKPRVHFVHPRLSMVGRLRRPHVLGGSSHGMDIRPDVRAAGGVRVGATLVVARPLVRCVLLNVRAGGKPRPYENAANGCCVGCPGVCRPCRVVWSPLRYMSAPQGSVKGLLAQFL